MPNKRYQKGIRFERDLVNQYLANGIYAHRTYGSKPFDFYVMNKNGVAIMGEAKNWSVYPPVKTLKKKYEWLAKYATSFNCDAILYMKHGRGKYNYTMHRLN
jgi:Holliday junction resolvase